MLTVKWIQRFADNSPIEIEASVFTDVDRVFALSRSQLPSKRLRVLNPPDGFIICDEDGYEIRRWLAEPIHPSESIVPSASTRHLPSRRQSARRKPCLIPS
jgi:hypothetical protein